MARSRPSLLITALAFGLVPIAAGCQMTRKDPPAPVSHYGAGTATPGRMAGGITISRGETVYTIAKQYNLPVRELIDINRLQPPYELLVGQRLELPALQEYTIKRGDTLYGISRMLRVDTRELARLNGLQEPYKVEVGQALRLPGGRGGPVDTNVVMGPRTAAPTNTRPSDGVGGKVQVDDLAPPGGKTAPAPSRPQTIEPAPPAAPIAAAPVPAKVVPPFMTSMENTTVAANRPSQPETPPARTGGKLSWPVKGKVLSAYGPKPDGLHNDGVNIAAPKGAPVAASDTGTVVYAGNELKGFGNLLLVRHADGWMTAYAHLDQMLVERGAKVKRGQRIATVGASGGVTAPQLHFEVRKGSQAVDPSDHLEGGMSGPT